MGIAGDSFFFIVISLKCAVKTNPLYLRILGYFYCLFIESVCRVWIERAINFAKHVISQSQQHMLLSTAQGMLRTDAEMELPILKKMVLGFRLLSILHAFTTFMWSYCHTFANLA